jgi:hypothetical protein
MNALRSFYVLSAYSDDETWGLSKTMLASQTEVANGSVDSTLFASKGGACLNALAP